MCGDLEFKNLVRCFTSKRDTARIKNKYYLLPTYTSIYTFPVSIKTKEHLYFQFTNVPAIELKTSYTL